jgi:hypothetical protein
VWYAVIANMRNCLPLAANGEVSALVAGPYAWPRVRPFLILAERSLLTRIGMIQKRGIYAKLWEHQTGGFIGLE